MYLSVFVGTGLYFVAILVLSLLVLGTGPRLTSDGMNQLGTSGTIPDPHHNQPAYPFKYCISKLGGLGGAVIEHNLLM